ncbi:ABC transporter ATP-binding protein [Streptomyces antibioticus]|uniref:ABC transporter ATP-binding protein n=1 Tax=Streptomyces antibioticus TaxID=1890 RepID=UPI0036F9BA28
MDRLTIAYGSFHAVRDISFRMGPGEVFGLIGPNGAGKTSVAEAVGGLRRPVREGSVSVCGKDPLRRHSAVSRLIGMQLQESQFPSRAKVGELCDLYEAIYRAPGGGKALLDAFGLTGRRRSLISDLSGGMRQRLALTLAQIGDVRLVVLDELTTGLDPEQRRGTWRAVRDLAARGVAVLLTSHAMDEVEALCGRVGVLREGELIALDSPARLIAEHAGPAAVSVAADADPRICQRLNSLGLPRILAGKDRRAEYLTNHPADYERIIGHLVADGLPAAAVSLRAPNLEDAYLRLVGAASGASSGASTSAAGTEKGGD